MQSFTMSIAEIATRSGIAKEVLRKWETRYGFPTPQRDGRGNRLYDATQLARLQQIYRLQQLGWRPGEIVPSGAGDLSALIDRSVVAVPHSAPSLAVMRWASHRNPHRLSVELRTEAADFGDKKFITEIVPQTTQWIGHAWSEGRLSIRDEHAYTQILQELLHGILAALPAPNDSRKVLLATLPGETHVLGILLVQTWLRSLGLHTVSLGGDVPIDELAAAAAEWHADIVAISISCAVAQKQIAPALRSLRARISRPTAIWIGGAGAQRLARVPRGVRAMYSFNEIKAELVNTCLFTAAIQAVTAT